MSKCEICGKEGYHKMSCPTQKVTVYLSDDVVPDEKELCDYCKNIIFKARTNSVHSSMAFLNYKKENCKCQLNKGEHENE